MAGCTVEIDGTVHFCCKDKPVAKLSDDLGLAEVWRSSRYASFRHAARDWLVDEQAPVIDRQCLRCSNFATNLEVAERWREDRAALLAGQPNTEVTLGDEDQRTED